jgi:hypothetical protein
LHDLAFKHKKKSLFGFLFGGTIPLPRPQIWRMTIEELISRYPCALFSPFEELFLVVFAYRARVN